MQERQESELGHDMISRSYILHSLLSPTHFLLPLLGAQFPLEAAIGVNGRVWISSVEKTASASGSTNRNMVKNTIAAVRCLEAYDEDDLDAKAILALLATFSL